MRVLLFQPTDQTTEPSTGGDDEEALKERNLILDAIDTRIEMVKLSEKRAETRYILTEPRRLSLPASDVINKIIRDESQHRRGENIPLSLDV